MDAQQSTLSVGPAKPVVRPAPQPKSELAERYRPRRVVDVTTTTRLEFGSCYIGDVAYFDAIEEEPALLPCIELRCCRDGRYRGAGMVEVVIGKHAYLVHGDDLADAVKRAQEAC